jgi:hypothetical protein
VARRAREHRHVSAGRPLLTTLALLAILALAAGWAAGPARADGDPASDVLATQQLFLPQNAALPTTEQIQLATLLQSAARTGYPVRVALIASPTDLGSITALWRQPQNYAEFLGQELTLAYRGPLLVVMPNGFGLYRFARPLAAERSTLAGINPSVGLGAAALTAVQHLAAAAGHPLPLASVSAAASPASTSPLPWIVFAIGAALIIAAWAASVRARPPRYPRRRAPSA